jgi:HPt (histidine-containing phosphotransfer) domain-containing protein
MSELLFEVDLLNMRTGYDSELLVEMFQIFRATYLDYFEMIDARMKNEDWVGVSGIAHRAKSSVAIMGMEEIRIEFGKMEDLCENGDAIDGCELWLKQLKTKVNLAVQQIDEYITRI